MTKRFNVRVYGILTHGLKVLVTDEYIRGINITKFPGGGLEFGEGTIDCIIREFKEELNLEIIVKEHFYTTDFFVQSAFDNTSQVISIYYLVECKNAEKIQTTDKIFDFEKTEGAQTFRWIETGNITTSDFTLVIDKKVGELLKEKFNQ